MVGKHTLCLCHCHRCSGSMRLILFKTMVATRLVLYKINTSWTCWIRRQIELMRYITERDTIISTAILIIVIGFIRVTVIVGGGNGVTGGVVAGSEKGEVRRRWISDKDNCPNLLLIYHRENDDGQLQKLIMREGYKYKGGGGKVTYGGGGGGGCTK